MTREDAQKSVEAYLQNHDGEQTELALGKPVYADEDEHYFFFSCGEAILGVTKAEGYVMPTPR